MSDLGKLLILVGIVLVVTGLVFIVLGRANLPGQTSWRHGLSREKHDSLFSGSHLPAAERVVDDCLVCLG